MAPEHLVEDARYSSLPEDNSLPQSSRTTPAPPSPGCWWGSVRSTFSAGSQWQTPILFGPMCVQMCLPGQGWMLYIFPSRRKCFLPGCLKKSQPAEKWENLGSIKDLEAPPPVLFFSGGFSFLWRQTLETAMFPSLRCVAASQIRPRE